MHINYYKKFISLVLIVYKKWIDDDLKGAAIYATLATFLLRFELILLFGPIFILIFAMKRNAILNIVLIGIFTLITTLGKLLYF
jgi:hypothetical protein